jgi:hypothetical protein
MAKVFFRAMAVVIDFTPAARGAFADAGAMRTHTPSPVQ